MVACPSEIHIAGPWVRYPTIQLLTTDRARDYDHFHGSPLAGTIVVLRSRNRSTR